MRPSTPRAPQGRSLVGTLGLALAVAAVMVGVSLGPAFSEDKDKRSGPPEHAQRGHQPARRAYQPYGYYAPPVIYAPPPVVYAPSPSPGISLFFDFPIRIR